MAEPKVLSLDPYDKHLFILDEEDMKKLSDGLPVHLIMDDETPTISLFTEEGYKKFQEFWGEEGEELVTNEATGN